MMSKLAGSPGGKPPNDGGAKEAARFLKDAIADLAIIARRHQLDMLGYLLDMARMEATDTVRRHKRGLPPE